jgi:hypothetical protein
LNDVPLHSSDNDGAVGWRDAPAERDTDDDSLMKKSLELLFDNYGSKRPSSFVTGRFF